LKIPPDDGIIQGQLMGFKDKDIGPTKDFCYKEFLPDGGDVLADEVTKARLEELATDILQPLHDVLGKDILIIQTDVDYKGCSVSIHIHPLPSSEIQLMLKGFIIARYIYTGKGGAVGEHRGFASIGINNEGTLTFD
jgi:hypothetical protein